MKIAVMQPYIFPYLGYYQLVAAADNFVFFDDVNFITKGWINRNRIIGQNEPFKFTVPLSKASQNKKINEIEITDYNKWAQEFLRLLSHTYKKALFFQTTFQWLEQLLSKQEYQLISQLAADSVISTASLLGVRTRFLKSSELNYRSENTSSGQDKILSICSILGADMYINPRNGTDLYSEAEFEAKNIQLRFIAMNEIEYGQFGRPAFEPALSILDVLMFNGVEKTKEYLQEYKLLQKQEVI